MVGAAGFEAVVVGHLFSSHFLLGSQRLCTLVVYSHRTNPGKHIMPWDDNIPVGFPAHRIAYQPPTNPCVGGSGLGQVVRNEAPRCSSSWADVRYWHKADIA